MTLKHRLLLFVTALVAAVVVVLSATAYWSMHAEILAGASNEIAVAVRGNVEALSRWVAQRRDAITAASTKVSGAADPVPFLDAGRIAGRFDQTFVGYADKRMIYHLPTKHAPADYDPTSRPWYKKANGSTTAVVSAPYIFASTKKLGLTFASPVVENGQTVGVVGGDISLEEMTALVQGIKLRGAGYAFLTTRDGKVIAHPAPESTLKPIGEVMPGLTENQLQEFLTKGSQTEIRLDGHDKYLTITEVPGTDWLLGFVTDKTEVLAPLDTLLIKLAVACLGVAVIAILIANFALTQLLSGLLKLRDALLEIAEGDADLTRTITVSRRDEIGLAAEAFNRFVATLRTIFAKVRDDAVGLSKGVHELHDATQRVSKESARQAQMSSENAATIEEMTVSINHIAANAHDAEAVAAQTGDTSQQSSRSVAALADEISSVLQDVEHLATTVASHGDRLSEINSIVAVIKEIADQTNLLALNAAIEAARAGEQGRGFAVVADEVRKLAERAGKATVEITQLSSGTEHEIQAVLSGMEKTRSSVKSSVARSTQAAEEIAGIQARMAQVVNSIRDIAAATHEQSVAANEMAKFAESANQVANETDAAVQQASGTVAQLNTVASGLSEIMRRFQV
ncbi:methyl-accepting chemotaxis protein [Andreprevotia chitinilytica]|uniref:methyl-accepting chemotaxis protein n=1 Tax=Andreprevotia chitinilytica TaxID=396808 RepID=UPI0005572E70|nr:methyl-accepting chemotaxis protein [Andreprevotia chitinilytica]